MSFFLVPPVIIESMTSNDMVVREGLNMTLMCKARGYPEPYVMWRREDGEEMLIGGEHGNFKQRLIDPRRRNLSNSLAVM